jgi:hypothetical protein
MKGPSVEPFTRPVLRDFAQEVMDAEPAQVDPDEMAQQLALLRESTRRITSHFPRGSTPGGSVHRHGR